MDAQPWHVVDWHSFLVGYAAGFVICAVAAAVGLLLAGWRLWER